MTDTSDALEQQKTVGTPAGVVDDNGTIHTRGIETILLRVLRGTLNGKSCVVQTSNPELLAIRFLNGLALGDRVIYFCPSSGPLPSAYEVPKSQLMALGKALQVAGHEESYLQIYIQWRESTVHKKCTVIQGT